MYSCGELTEHIVVTQSLCQYLTPLDGGDGGAEVVVQEQDVARVLCIRDQQGTVTRPGGIVRLLLCSPRHSGEIAKNKKKSRNEGLVVLLLKGTCVRVHRLMTWKALISPVSFPFAYLCHRRAREAHGEADVGALECWGVVCAVAQGPSSVLCCIIPNVTTAPSRLETRPRHFWRNNIYACDVIIMFVVMFYHVTLRCVTVVMLILPKFGDAQQQNTSCLTIASHRHHLPRSHHRIGPPGTD